MRALALAIGALCLALDAPPAAAAGRSAIEDAQEAQLDALRAQVASQIQLQAFDLLDELVFGWTQAPVFAKPTPVVLADVTVPVGLGTALEALIENHFASLVLAHPKSNVVLAHCPQCSGIVVHSGAAGTVVSRGVDAPEALAQAGGLAGSRHAVFIDFEAEGASLVMRARVTAIEPALPILFARTISSAGSASALLRAGDHLKSAAEARREYLDALEGRGTFTVPVRVAVRSYATSYASPINAVPFLWLQAGVEAGLTQARVWTASFSLGYTWMPESHSGWLAQARLARLVSGMTRSLTQPDVYLFLGASAISLEGPTAALFKKDMPDVNDVLALIDPTRELRVTFAAWQLGLEVRIKNRISAGAYLEALPALNEAPALGNYLDLGITKFQTMGAEVSFCF